MKQSMLIMVILLMGNNVFSQNTTTLLNNYMNVKNALVSADEKGVSKAISILYESIKDESNFAEKEVLLKATEKMSKANGIEKQRAVFNDVSTTIWKVVKKADKVEQPVYYQYCPMKKAYWLSKEKEIKNPYYGSSMLTCGNVSETKK